jgi:uncharacterized protein (DUF4213/DUF364 family)
MRLLQDLINSLKADHSVTTGVVGPHLIAVKSQRVGLAANLLSPMTSGSIFSLEEPGSLTGRSARQLVDWLLKDKWLDAGIGMAALNSMLDIEYESLTDINAKLIIEDRAAGKNLVVVGHFPFVEELRSKVRNLWIMEKEPREGDLSEEEGYQVLAEADVVAITGSSLINHTFERIVRSCRLGSFKIILGPSTPLSPILFDSGIDVIGGTLVEDESRVLSMVEEGFPFRRLKGVRTVVMAKEALGKS